MEAKLAALLDQVRQGGGKVLALTGAGISAESGIPTFRGKDGYWTVGSKVYQPQEIATLEMFRHAPEEVWRWYLYRFGVCRSAEPNEGHRALVRLGHALGERFTLITQNVDGLHRRAGSDGERTFCIHGDASRIRCADGCAGETEPMPELPPRAREAALAPNEREALHCRRCGAWMRPHVLWFDECYDEPFYRADSAVRAAWEAALLLVVGTSGATTLPMRIGELAYQRRIALVDVNPEPNPFSELAERSPMGFAVRGSASEQLPAIAARLSPP
jgi:NAD-dependent deacetylase